MREAIHVIEKKSITLPINATGSEVANFKKLAKKQLYMCPYCDASLIVKAGEKRGIYFSHLHSEACATSIIVDKAEKRYSKQIERETPKHKVLIDIVYDELLTQTRYKKDMEVEYGFKAKPELKYFPDVWLKKGEVQIGISIVTNVHPSEDMKLAKQIEARHRYLQEHGMESIWFIENKELAIEYEKRRIVLWDIESNVALKNNEDLKWEELLKQRVNDSSFFAPYGYTPSMNPISIDVQSLYYLYPDNNGSIVVYVRRYIKDRATKPQTGFLLNEGYEIPFSTALVMKDELQLSSQSEEEHLRKLFLELHIQKVREYEEEKRQQIIEHKRHQSQNNKQNSTLNYPKMLLKLRELFPINQEQQMELWNVHMSKIGFKYTEFVYNLAVDNNVRSFDEFRTHLRKKWNK